MGAGLTQWGKKAKRALVGREARTVFFEGSNLPKPGDRDAGLLRLLGQCISLFYPSTTGAGIPGTTPEHILALAYNTCLTLGCDDDGTPWEVRAWSMVRRLWQEESLKDKAPPIKDLEAGIKAWNPDADSDWARQHAIASWNKHNFVMTQEGVYDTNPTYHHQLVARIRELGMEKFMPIKVPKQNGIGYRDITSQELLNAHGTVIRDIEGVVGQTGGVLRKDVLSIGLFHRRTDVKPERSDQVDDWLQRLCPTKESYTKLCTWIGHALAFENGPICAISMSGPPGCGKKMFAQGLGECINTQVVADSGCMGRFQDELLNTPFMVINEGLPKQKDSLDPADTFRKFTGGDAIYVERKFMAKMMIHNPVRIIITANNLGVLRTLASHRNLSPDDRDALAQRLFHIDIPEDAGNWLRKMGGLRWTGTPGRRWIRGDGGESSDSVIARHFLWLHEVRPSVPASNRLLVEGDRQAEIIRMLSTQSGSAPDVIEIITKMIESKVTAAGIHIQDRAIYVTAAGVVHHCRNNMQTSGIKLTMNAALDVLRGLTAPGWDSDASRMLSLDDGKKSIRSRWFKINGDLLYREATDCGYPCEKLEELVNPLSKVTTPDELPLHK